MKYSSKHKRKKNFFLERETNRCTRCLNEQIKPKEQKKTVHFSTSLSEKSKEQGS